MADTIYLKGATTSTIFRMASSQGPAGPAGTDGDKTYVHNQVAPVTRVTVTHNLGKFPAITAIDSGGNRVFGNVENETMNSFEIDFGSLLFNGTIRCN